MKFSSPYQRRHNRWARKKRPINAARFFEAQVFLKQLIKKQRSINQLLRILDEVITTKAKQY